MPKGQINPSKMRRELGRERGCKLAKVTREITATAGPGGVLGALGDRDKDVEATVMEKLSETDHTHDRLGTAG